jgi:predicted glycosyltransferase
MGNSMQSNLIRLDQFAIDKGHLLSYKKQNQLALIVNKMILKTTKQRTKNEKTKKIEEMDKQICNYIAEAKSWRK